MPNSVDLNVTVNRTEMVVTPVTSTVFVGVTGAATVQVLDQAESPIVVQSPAAAIIEVQTAAPSTVDVVSVGVPGLSAYQVAVANGFEGTEAEWLESLRVEGSFISNNPDNQLEVGPDDGIFMGPPQLQSAQW